MKIILLGGGGHASDVLAALEALLADAAARGLPAPFEVLGFLDNAEVRADRYEGRDCRHLGGLDRIGELGATHYVSCVGAPNIRRKDAARGQAAGLQAFTILHPRAWVPPTASVGPGSVVLAGSCLSPKTVLGAHAIVGQGAIVGHDVKAGDFVSIMPAACVSGDVTIGEGAFIGANATIIERLAIGAGATVGAGAVVSRDVPERITVVGVPARPLAR